ncbi:unnamed protein product [Moneuplotes crassus]|uniref:Uncharacterized protein n=1 Tax=Euplotes crassus TaxID=5936 RepID=A0AAD1TZL6_EUPCR|nr:unnamed protein product [Moneuplotes crassus]
MQDDNNIKSKKIFLIRKQPDTYYNLLKNEHEIVIPGAPEPRPVTNLTRVINRRLKQTATFDSEWQDMVLIRFCVQVKKLIFEDRFLWCSKFYQESTLKPFCYQLLLDKIGPQYLREIGDQEQSRLIDTLCRIIDVKCQEFKRIHGIKHIMYDQRTQRRCKLLNSKASKDGSKGIRIKLVIDKQDLELIYDPFCKYLSPETAAEIFLNKSGLNIYLRNMVAYCIRIQTSENILQQGFEEMKKTSDEEIEQIERQINQTKIAKIDLLQAEDEADDNSSRRGRRPKYDQIHDADGFKDIIEFSESSNKIQHDIFIDKLEPSEDQDDQSILTEEFSKLLNTHDEDSDNINNLEGMFDLLPKDIQYVDPSKIDENEANDLSTDALMPISIDLNPLKNLSTNTKNEDDAVIGSESEPNDEQKKIRDLIKQNTKKDFRVVVPGSKKRTEVLQEISNNPNRIETQESNLSNTEVETSDQLDYNLEDEAKNISPSDSEFEEPLRRAHIRKCRLKEKKSMYSKFGIDETNKENSDYKNKPHSVVKNAQKAILKESKLNAVSSLGSSSTSSSITKTVILEYNQNVTYNKRKERFLIKKKALTEDILPEVKPRRRSTRIVSKKKVKKQSLKIDPLILMTVLKPSKCYPGYFLESLIVGDDLKCFNEREPETRRSSRSRSNKYENLCENSLTLNARCKALNARLPLTKRQIAQYNKNQG